MNSEITLENKEGLKTPSGDIIPGYFTVELYIFNDKNPVRIIYHEDTETFKMNDIFEQFDTKSKMKTFKQRPENIKLIELTSVMYYKTHVFEKDNKPIFKEWQDLDYSNDEELTFVEEMMSGHNVSLSKLYCKNPKLYSVKEYSNPRILDGTWMNIIFIPLVLEYISPKYKRLAYCLESKILPLFTKEQTLEDTIMKRLSIPKSLVDEKKLEELSKLNNTKKGELSEVYVCELFEKYFPNIKKNNHNYSMDLCDGEMFIEVKNSEQDSKAILEKFERDVICTSLQRKLAVYINISSESNLKSCVKINPLRFYINGKDFNEQQVIMIKNTLDYVNSDEDKLEIALQNQMLPLMSEFIKTYKTGDKSIVKPILNIDYRKKYSLDSPLYAINCMYKQKIPLMEFIKNNLQKCVDGYQSKEFIEDFNKLLIKNNVKFNKRTIQYYIRSLFINKKIGNLHYYFITSDTIKALESHWKTIDKSIEIQSRINTEECLDYEESFKFDELDSDEEIGLYIEQPELSSQEIEDIVKEFIKKFSNRTGKAGKENDFATVGFINSNINVNFRNFAPEKFHSIDLDKELRKYCEVRRIEGEKRNRYFLDCSKFTDC